MGITGTGSLVGIDIKAQFIGSDELAARFRSAGDAVREAVKGVIVEAALTVQTAMRARAPRRSGRAADSIRARIRAKRSWRIAAYIGPNRRYRYLAQMEYGTIGTYKVKPGPQAIWVGAHKRRVRSWDRYSRVMGPNGKRKRMQTVSGETSVRAYRRVAHMPRKPFARPAAALVQGTLARRVQAAAAEATAATLRKGNG